MSNSTRIDRLGFKLLQNITIEKEIKKYDQSIAEIHKDTANSKKQIVSSII